MSDTSTQDPRMSPPLPDPDGSPGERMFAGYQGGEEMPLPAFGAIMGLYSAAFAALIGSVRHREQPERMSLGDLLLLGAATHKLARLITHDWVTSPFRAPSTTYQGSSGAGEVKEQARGTGMQRAQGALFT